LVYQLLPWGPHSYVDRNEIEEVGKAVVRKMKKEKKQKETKG